MKHDHLALLCRQVTERALEVDRVSHAQDCGLRFPIHLSDDTIAGDPAPVGIEPCRMEHAMQIGGGCTDAGQHGICRCQLHEDRLNQIFCIMLPARQGHRVPVEGWGMAVVEPTKGLGLTGRQVREQLMIVTVVARACHS